MYIHIYRGVYYVCLPTNTTTTTTTTTTLVTAISKLLESHGQWRAAQPALIKEDTPESKEIDSSTRTCPASACSPRGLMILRQQNATHQTLQRTLFFADLDIPLLTRSPHTQSVNMHECWEGSPSRHCHRVGMTEYCITNVSLKSMAPMLPPTFEAHDVMCLSTGAGPFFR